MDEESLLRKILAGELHYAKLWLVCVALRGVSWDKMPFEQRELAFQAKDAAFNCLSTFLNSASYRCASTLRVSTQADLLFPELHFAMRYMIAWSQLLSLVCSYSKWPTSSLRSWIFPL